MSKSERLVLAAFEVVAVGTSYAYNTKIEAWLATIQPSASSFTIGIETAFIVVVPTVLFGSFVLRSIGKKSRKSRE